MLRNHPPPVIGGVFALGPVTGAADPTSLLSTWTRNAAAAYCFHNARGAVRHVLRDAAPRRFWLPAYACACHRVFAPRHWRMLTSPARDFAQEHELSRTEITLPCDQRYGEDDLERLVSLVRGFRQ